jgi:uncharacterized protein (UPF0248 family)
MNKCREKLLEQDMKIKECENFIKDLQDRTKIMTEFNSVYEISREKNMKEILDKMQWKYEENLNKCADIIIEDRVKLHQTIQYTDIMLVGGENLEYMKNNFWNLTGHQVYCLAHNPNLDLEFVLSDFKNGGRFINDMHILGRNPAFNENDINAIREQADKFICNEGCDNIMKRENLKDMYKSLNNNFWANPNLPFHYIEYLNFPNDFYYNGKFASILENQFLWNYEFYLKNLNKDRIARKNYVRDALAKMQISNIFINYVIEFTDYA